MPGPIIYVPSRVGEGHFTDFQSPASGATDNGKIWAWNSATSKFEPISIPSTSPGGSTGYVQYNNGVFAGHSGFAYDGAGKATLSTAIAVPAIRPPSDSTASLSATDAAGTTSVWVANTTNYAVGVGPGIVPGADYTLYVQRSWTNPTANKQVVGGILTVSASSTHNFDHTGMTLSATTSGAGTIRSMSGLLATVKREGSGVLTNAIGVDSLVQNNTAGNLANAIGVRAAWWNLNAGGTVTNAYRFYGQKQFNLGSTITNEYGLYLDDVNMATNNYAIYTNAGTVRFGGNVQQNGNNFSGSNLKIGLDVGAVSRVSIFNIPTTNAAATTYNIYSNHSPSVTQTGPVYGIDSLVSVTYSGAGGNVIGVAGEANMSGSGSASYMFGAVGNVGISGGTVSRMMGLYNDISISGGSPAEANGVFTVIGIGNATLPVYRAIRLDAMQFDPGGSITDAYGLYVSSFSGASNSNYAIYTNAGDIRLMASNSDRIGFHGVTPVARQLLATGAGRTVDDVITFLQNLGLARQS